MSEPATMFQYHVDKSLSDIQRAGDVAFGTADDGRHDSDRFNSCLDAALRRIVEARQAAGRHPGDVRELGMALLDASRIVLADSHTAWELALRA